MAIFKCKMCGGDLDVAEGKSVGACQYCGTQQTLPRLDDDKRVNLYGRANHFRRQNDFDKAAALYDTILNEDRTDAEAYWSLVLCKYGVEYVEDPATHKRIPTCNRTQYASILADEDFKQAIANADGYQRRIYEEEAKAIDGIQKGILDVSNDVEPFDVFICYKEADDSGRRTPDSVLAQDLYHQLANEGFKVFFSRITLEDKIGVAYEPYIFAALQSSKIMVAIGTRPEYFNAVWVKNEWSRYLALIKGGAEKVPIPAYRDMDAYDLPEEFSHLQAQDMGKLGFMQDLIRGIHKLLDGKGQTVASQPTPVVVGMSGNAEALLRRAYLCLEDKNWAKADELLEQVLNINPENSQAYMCRLLVERQITSEVELISCDQPLTGSANYQKALRFADAQKKPAFEGYETERAERVKRDQIAADEIEREQAYANAVELMACAESIVPETSTAMLRKAFIYNSAANEFTYVGRYKEALQNKNRCEIIEKELREKSEVLKITEQGIRNAKLKRLTLIISPIVAAIIALCIIFIAIPNHQQVLEIQEKLAGIKIETIHQTDRSHDSFTTEEYSNISFLENGMYVEDACVEYTYGAYARSMNLTEPSDLKFTYEGAYSVSLDASGDIIVNIGSRPRHSFAFMEYSDGDIVLLRGGEIVN
jgi:tetratricopeptide (TPR) repeat protein